VELLDPSFDSISDSSHSLKFGSSASTTIHVHSSVSSSIFASQARVIASHFHVRVISAVIGVVKSNLLSFKYHHNNIFHVFTISGSDAVAP
jgi:hypothetical protein